MYGRTFELWDEIKAHALELARSTGDAAANEECARLLQSLLDRRHMHVPQQVFDFYLEEMCGLIEHYRSAV